MGVFLRKLKTKNMKVKKAKIRPNYSATLREMPIGSSLAFDIELNTYSSLTVVKSRLVKDGYNISITSDANKVYVTRNA